MLHDALPLATTAAFTPGRAHTVAPAGHWQVALARAAAAGESTEPIASRPVAAEVAGMSDARDAAASGGAPAAPEVATRRIPPSAHATRTPGLQPAAPALPPLAASGIGALSADPLPPVRWSVAPLAEIQAPEAEAPSRPRQQGRVASDPHLATRIHVEQHEDAGMTVWLGADGDATTVALKAAALLAELQRALPLAGHRLARLVCNGVSVYVAPHLEKETS